jgi:hypothetical protein
VEHWFQLLVSFGALPGLLVTDVPDWAQRVMTIPRLLTVIRLKR